jgi:signal transduction histidine kinase
MVRAAAHSRLERYEEALEGFLAAQSAYEDLEDHRGVAQALNNASIIYTQRGDLETALAMRRRAAALLGDLGERRQRATVVANIGEIQQQRGEHDAALACFREALLLLDEEGEEGTATAHVLSGLAKLLTHQGHHEEAIAHLERSLEVLERTGYEEGHAGARVDLGAALIAHGDLERAESVLQEALSRAAAHGILRYEREARRRLSQLAERQGDHARALEHYRHVAALNEKLFDEARAKQIALMEARFHLERKEREAEIYRLRYVELQQQTEERLRAERALIEAQRLESLGVMAGGVAHDFNNLLVSMLGQTSLAMHLLDENAPAHAAVAKAVHAAERAAALAHQMLAYAGRTTLERETCRLDDIVGATLPLLETTVGQQVSLRLLPCPHLPSILADQSQCEQVLLNLVLNAAEADARTITIELTERSLTEDEPGWDTYTGIAPAAGDYVALCVSDNGTGIARSHLPRLFDPFFTTKDTGSGLGLAAVVGIVRSHEGGLRVESALGEGTSMTLLFPIALSADPTT